MEIFTKNSAKCTIFQRNDCNNFSSLMESSKYMKKCNVSAMYGHTSSQDSGHSGGCGHFGGRGRFGGRGGGHSGGQGGGGSDRSNFINGIDVLDPTQNFTDEEFRKLAYNGGWLYVAQA
jgi:hypothetical protein